MTAPTNAELVARARALAPDSHLRTIEARTLLPFLADRLEMLEVGLRQIVESNYPSDAGDAETWAAELLADPSCVAWEAGDDG